MTWSKVGTGNFRRSVISAAFAANLNTMSSCLLSKHPILANVLVFSRRKALICLSPSGRSRVVVLQVRDSFLNIRGPVRGVDMWCSIFPCISTSTVFMLRWLCLWRSSSQRQAVGGIHFLCCSSFVLYISLRVLGGNGRTWILNVLNSFGF